jgi:hypothetical protein
MTAPELAKAAGRGSVQGTAAEDEVQCAYV